MKLWSDSWVNGERIPVRHAAGRLDTPEGVTFADNVSPHLAWSDLPAGTRSLVLICHDFDVPSRGDDVNQTGREIPADLPRVDFFHWLLVDLPASVGSLPAGAFSQGFTPKGKSGPDTLRGARHGLNDYTGWFAGDPQMGGNYFGYDGPFPPFNDALVHRYVFTIYALDLERCPVEGAFTGTQVGQAIGGHVLDKASITGTYTLNKRLREG